MIEQAECFGCERKNANPAALAAHPDLRVCDEQVPGIERQDFARTKTVQDHEAHDGEIAGVAETLPEP